MIYYLKKAIDYFALLLFCTFLTQCGIAQQKNEKPRILISSDIGGTDPDDFQSMIHLLMYADQFQIEGLVSSPFGNGTKENFLDMINLYEKDLPQLSKHSKEFPSPNSLRSITKQGAKYEAPYKGFNTTTEGSDWIVKCAKKKSDKPLWVLVWGGIEDVAQALHDAPEIKENIKVYWIGGPNKKWSINAYTYIAENHPDLWMIEANATYRGWFIDNDSPKNITGEAYYGNYINGRGSMGKDFIKYYDGHIKMGDTPSLVYVMNGDPNDPTGESWGGKFTPIKRSSRTVFQHNSTRTDTVPAYGILEWKFKGPELAIPKDSVCFKLEIAKQIWPGYYLGDGIYAVRYSSKKPETGSYVTISNIPELNGQTGQYTSIVPWPGKPGPNDYLLGDNWYSDVTDNDLFIDDQQGAKTISKYRKAFLLDWAKRWEWLKK
ncbi:nucleoside hydrolase-like domain-containing protein [Mariniflexile soesokkakense]|uniref:Nucleoside hydrolase-like domain-containing protein n=1 Tax=Mariniflexile soesokkakense TaxID=1343160 RepID=A0ABV0ACC6_9FLAO